VKSGTPLPPLLCGGGQEGGMRSGTENTPAICGLGMAASLAEKDMAERAQREKDLLDLFVKQLSTCNVRVLGAERSPGVMALLIPGCESETLIAKLDLKGILVSGGAACAAGSHQTSHVYRAMGLSEQEAGCVLRFSPGRRTTLEEIDTTADALIALWKEYQQK
jgi:cysteine desulfurase